MLSDVLKQAFFEGYDRLNGNVTAAARELGLNKNTAAGWARMAGLKGRGGTGAGPHPRKAEYFQLRQSGKNRREAATHVGVNERTARDWDQGIRKSSNQRRYPDGRVINYKTGMITFAAATTSDASMHSIEADLHPRFLGSSRTRV